MHHTPARESSVRPPRTRARLLILAAVVLALLVSVLTTTSAIPAFAGTPRPSIVLVHGAFSGPSAWDEVAAGLHKDGYTTVTPALTLSGLADDVATVRATLDATPGPKILVGHSYGGFVVSNAATGRTDVAGLVFTAAFLPDHGETIVGLGTGYAPASLRILSTPSGQPAWRDLPSWYAISGVDRVMGPALQRDMASRARATVVTFDDASHAGGFTHYSTRFVKLVEQAATAR